MIYAALWIAAFIFLALITIAAFSALFLSVRATFHGIGKMLEATGKFLHL